MSPICNLHFGLAFVGSHAFHLTVNSYFFLTLYNKVKKNKKTFRISHQQCHLHMLRIRLCPQMINHDRYSSSLRIIFPYMLLTRRGKLHIIVNIRTAFFFLFFFCKNNMQDTGITILTRSKYDNEVTKKLQSNIFVHQTESQSLALWLQCK